MALEILAVVLPILIGVAAMWLKNKFTNHVNAISSIEAGVLHAWEVYGKQRKVELQKEFDDPTNDRDSVKFDAEDISKLKELAKDKAVEVMGALTKGTSLASALDPSLWDLEIKKAVDRVKNQT